MASNLALALDWTDPAEDPDLIRQARKLARFGEREFFLSLGKSFASLTPNRPMSIRAWARTHVFIPANKTSKGGYAELTPIQSGIVDLIQTIGVESLVWIKGPRIGASTLSSILAHYYWFWEQSDVLVYERTDPKAQEYNKEKFMPMLRASAKLREFLRPDGKTGEQDSWHDREFMNGAAIKFRSVSNDDSFKGIRGRLIICEEAGDGAWQPAKTGSEGSKLDLAMRRGQEFSDGKVFISGTPTVVGSCLVSEEYGKTDKRVFVMTCPHCETRQPWEPDVRRVFDKSVAYGPGLRYVLDDTGNVSDVWMECANLDCPVKRILPGEKLRMMTTGTFEATAVGQRGKVGVYTWMAHSTDAKADWATIAEKHDALFVRGSEEDRKSFVTMWLGKPFDPSPVREIDPTSLEGRAETWTLADGSPADAPEWAEALFAGIDAQQGSLDDQTKPPRLEMTIHAVGRNRRRAVIGHHIISHRDLVDRVTGEIERVPVEPFTAACADIVWDLVERNYATEDGRKLRIKRTFVDTGWRPDDAQRFCKLKRSKDVGILPIRGHSGEKSGSRQSLLPVNLMLAKGRKSGRDFLPIGTQTAKDTLGRLLGIPAPGPESIVFSADLPRDYFEGLLAEHLVEIRPGVRRWVPVSAANTGEPLDCLVYSYAAERYEMRKNARLKNLVEPIDRDAAEAALAVQAASQSESETPAPPADEASGTAVHSAVETVQPEAEHSGVRFRVVRRTRRENASDRPADAPSDKVQRVRRRKTGIGW